MLPLCSCGGSSDLMSHEDGTRHSLYSLTCSCFFSFYSLACSWLLLDIQAGSFSTFWHAADFFGNTTESSKDIQYIRKLFSKKKNFKTCTRRLCTRKKFRTTSCSDQTYEVLSLTVALAEHPHTSGRRRRDQPPRACAW